MKEKSQKLRVIFIVWTAAIFVLLGCSYIGYDAWSLSGGIVAGDRALFFIMGWGMYAFLVPLLMGLLMPPHRYTTWMLRVGVGALLFLEVFAPIEYISFDDSLLPISHALTFCSPLYYVAVLLSAGLMLASFVCSPKPVKTQRRKHA